ncbi:hypothetical protein HUZ36_14230 [Pseudoalteromonas sp. McH1-7]|uniref:Uncharacterized protein n=1 Tax=Pseudoalteromonas peptidolytica F12-50-A1 TaxID=1315280 RepID=A0A8I0MYZ0_9GAMM|nr:MULTISPECIES: hypothetical protein [Pseudoalteromonas]MBE0347893.1 hypothetical protein [Pseudoalteromonas peptidolytica F12-50-A1]MDW7551327.1 hypothetical protein [Pseudoalteromonas peptidolytica]NLR15307.1 hypothetical protein [Pseudoalteromonas peptidolytica]NUZ11942.1 hypothetical protein [Pseudoalteromonas sp. McH1-7]RXF05539.1 hypothetical protein D9603_03735 [Pseudoalteromonas sp. PS5]
MYSTSVSQQFYQPDQSSSGGSSTEIQQSYTISEPDGQPIHIALNGQIDSTKHVLVTLNGLLLDKESQYSIATQDSKSILLIDPAVTIYDGDKIQLSAKLLN